MKYGELGSFWVIDFMGVNTIPNKMYHGNKDMIFGILLKHNFNIIFSYWFPDL